MGGCTKLGGEDMKRYVVYLRVSTEDQGRSGLGLAAQERDVALFLENFSEEPWEVAGRFLEVESGGDDDRPELAKALALVRKTGAELLVAKVDRLSRRVSFIAGLIEDPKVRLRVASMPFADKFALHIYSALAEQERDFISARTKAALAQRKAQGAKLGGLRPGTEARNAAVQAGARTRALKLEPMIRSMREGGMTLQQIADHLTATGVQTARGASWHPSQVARTLARLEAVST